MLITREELELHRIPISKAYTPGELDYRGTEFQQVSSLTVEGTAELLGSDVRVRGHVDTRIEALCDRCLAAVEVPVSRDFDLAYRPVSTIAREQEIEVPKDELNVGFYSGSGVELADVVVEQVILSIPMKVLCSSTCRGLCSTCGADLNRQTCKCPPPAVDSPFAALKQ